MWIGRWSDFSCVQVCHVAFVARCIGAIVMSGDVGCWCAFPVRLKGCRVCVRVLSDMCDEFCMRSAISSPRLSSERECHM